MRRRLLGLTEAVKRNSSIDEVNLKLAIIEHLDVPYNKPPMGFTKE